MPSIAALLAAGFLTACGTAATVPQQAGSAATTYVLVDQDAWFYQAPNDEAPRQSASTSPRTGDAINTRALPQRFEWVADHGNWIEVRPATDAPSHCVQAPGVMRAFDVRLFVKRSALVPVVTETVKRTQPDGTAASVVAGRWLRRGQHEIVETRKHLRPPRPDVRIPLPAAAIGDRYVRGAMRPKLDDWTYYDAPDAVFARGWEPSEGVIRPVLAITSDPARSGYAIVTMRGRCVETTRSVQHVGKPGVARPSLFGTSDMSGGAIDPFVGGSFGGFEKAGGGSAKPTPPPPELPKGTPLYWPQGQLAGATATATTPSVELTSSQPDRRCFGWGAFISLNQPAPASPKWHFCVEASAAAR